MKKLIYMLSFLAIGFASCDPMEDTYDELDASGADAYVQSMEYTLTDDDYDAMGEEYGEPGKYDNFSSSVDPADFLADFIADKFAVLDAGSDINITYEYYFGGLDYIKNYERLNYLQLTNDDYDSMGTEYGEPGRYNNFAYNVDPNEFLPDFLAGVYPDAESGFIVEVNYKYYSDYVTSIVSAYWAFDGSVWANAAYDTYTLTSDDYDSMGEEKDEPGEYNNFAYDVATEDFLPAFFSAKYPDAPTNALVYITYKYYDGSAASTISEYWAFDGSTWSLYNADIEVPSDVNRYDLVDADYEEMGFYGVFDEEDNADLISVFLEQNMPYAQDGEVYAVTFKYLDDEVIARSAVQYTKTGEKWVAYVSSEMRTDQYIYSTTGWVYDPTILYTMAKDDYQIIVDYVVANFGDTYVDSYGTAETYYGAGAYYENFSISSSYYNGDEFSTWQDAVKEAVKIWLPVKFPNAPAQVNGVDNYFLITFETYDGSNTLYTIRYQCMGNNVFEYTEGPTLVE